MSAFLHNPNLGEIGQIALTVGDLERAVIFYRDTLGLQLLFKAPPAMAFFACGSIRLMLSQGEKLEGNRYGGVVYFKVARIQDSYDALVARGATFEKEPHLIAKMPDHELWMAFLRDPDQNVLALMCEKR